MKKISTDRNHRESKVLPTTCGKIPTKKFLIQKYHRNNPQMTASGIAKNLRTTPNYVWKVLSEARQSSKNIRGRRGRIFAHGKVFYEWWVTQKELSVLQSHVVNTRTGLRQIGFKKGQDPCSCQIHPNGHLIIWPRSSGWRDWLTEEFCNRGWTIDIARLVIENASLNIKVVEGGIKPMDPGFLPKDFLLETDWGVVLARDDSPERGVLELKISIPQMQTYLGIPVIRKKLELIEQGTITTAQRQKAIEAILYMILRLLEKRLSKNNADEQQC